MDVPLSPLLCHFLIDEIQQVFAVVPASTMVRALQMEVQPGECLLDGDFARLKRHPCERVFPDGLVDAIALLLFSTRLSLDPCPIGSTILVCGDGVERHGTMTGILIVVACAATNPNRFIPPSRIVDFTRILCTD